MPDIFKIYEWLFEEILWIPVIAILLLVLVGVGYVLCFPLGLVIGVWGLFIWPACIYAYFEVKKENKAKKR